ncbi:MAG: hypothetical protein C0391_03780 [Anaerolinea sp.]|nr:hypothetical protein [Anaerolinea sp.]
MNKCLLKLPLWMVIFIWWLSKSQIDKQRPMEYLDFENHVIQIIRALPVPRTKVQRRVTEFLISRLYELRMKAWKQEMKVVRDVLGRVVIY